MRRWIIVTLVLIAAAIAVSAGAAWYLLRNGPASSPPTITSNAPAHCGPSNGPGSDGNWTTYHRDAARDGSISAPPISSAGVLGAGPVVLDGSVYAEPLTCGDAVYVATEDDSVYALNATTGSLLWKTHLGDPVPGALLPCGDIDPSGITGTPVIDTSNHTLYVVAYLSLPHHVLFGLNTTTGSVVWQADIDPPGAVVTAQQQRGALALANGNVYVPYGGLDGDCGAYHGWVVGIPTTGHRGLFSFQVPTGREGGIWSVAGMAVASNGNLFIATGNGDSTTTYDQGNSVLELAPNLTEVDSFAPVNWAALNRNDTDLGSVAPTLLPNGEVFQIGKEGVGYLLSEGHLGGIGGELSERPVCAGAYGATARVGLTIFVPCTDGLYALDVVAGNLTVVWHTTSFDAGPPIVTGNVTWSIDIGTAHLRGFDVATGSSLYSYPLGSVDHFVSPCAGGGRLYVGAGDQFYEFVLR